MVNNLVSQNICLRFNSGSNNRQLLNSNIINNNSPNGNGVIYIVSGGEYYIKYSIFLNNQNYLFYISSGKLFLENNLIQHNSGYFSSPNGQYITTNNNNSLTNNNLKTLILLHFGTIHCNVDYLNNNNNNQNSILKFNSLINNILILQFLILFIYNFNKKLKYF